MRKIIACLDSSEYAEPVCVLSAWASERCKTPVSLLHVVSPHSEALAKGSDLSGQIGVSANAELLEELTKIDEDHSKMEVKKGLSILDRAKTLLEDKGVTNPDVLHRRGSLVEIIPLMENDIELVVMGKRGEDAGGSLNHLGSNLECVAREVHKPLLVVPKNVRPPNRFLIAYDGSNSAQKAVAYISETPLLKGLECYLLKVGEETYEAQILLKVAKDKLTSAGFKVKSLFVSNKSVSDAVESTVIEHAIDLLAIGAYGHSKIRSLILGSTTTLLIQNSKIPLLLFR